VTHSIERVYRTATSDDELAYEVEYQDYPAGVIDTTDLRSFWAAIQLNIITANKGTLVAQREGTVQGAPAIEAAVRFGSGIVAHYRVILVANRLYFTWIFATPSLAGSPDEARFLDSFKFDSAAAAGPVA
jgi:hypothetical protein